MTVHGHADAPELREQLRGLLADQRAEPGVSAPGAFVQLIEFITDGLTVPGGYIVQGLLSGRGTVIGNVEAMGGTIGGEKVRSGK